MTRPMTSVTRPLTRTGLTWRSCSTACARWRAIALLRSTTPSRSAVARWTSSSNSHSLGERGADGADLTVDAEVEITVLALEDAAVLAERLVLDELELLHVLQHRPERGEMLHQELVQERSDA